MIRYAAKPALIAATVALATVLLAGCNPNTSAAAGDSTSAPVQSASASAPNSSTGNAAPFDSTAPTTSADPSNSSGKQTKSATPKSTGTTAPTSAQIREHLADHYLQAGEDFELTTAPGGYSAMTFDQKGHVRFLSSVDGLPGNRSN